MAVYYDPDKKRQEEEYQRMLNQQRMGMQNYGAQGAAMLPQQAQNVPTYGQQAQSVPTYGQQAQGQTGAQSEAVMAAEQYLQGQQAQNPQNATINNYSGQLSGLLQQIRNGTGFQYDAATDPLYNIYKDLYIQNGRRAMQDTIGQAAALTGGYGNSYAQSAGQQQYGQYMEGLNAMIPQLQQQAFSQYSDLVAQDLAERQYQDNLALQWAQYNLDKETPTTPTVPESTVPNIWEGLNDPNYVKPEVDYKKLLSGGRNASKKKGDNVLNGILGEDLEKEPKNRNKPWYTKGR